LCDKKYISSAPINVAELSSLMICVWVISAVSLSVGIFVLPFE
jgi:hypothetical protein